MTTRQCNCNHDEITFPEQFLTLKAAAHLLGVPVFKIIRAARAGTIPTYTLFNRRKLCRLSEVIAVIEGSAALAASVMENAQ